MQQSARIGIIRDSADASAAEPATHLKEKGDGPFCLFLHAFPAMNTQDFHPFCKRTNLNCELKKSIARKYISFRFRRSEKDTRAIHYCRVVKMIGNIYCMLLTLASGMDARVVLLGIQIIRGFNRNSGVWISWNPVRFSRIKSARSECNPAIREFLCDNVCRLQFLGWFHSHVQFSIVHPGIYSDWTASPKHQWGKLMIPVQGCPQVYLWITWSWTRITWNFLNHL